jgi:Zn-dependent M16 (insulinase) family peptidase
MAALSAPPRARPPFALQSEVAVPELAGPVRTYVHGGCGVRVVVSPVPGPLCAAYIVVPTAVADDRGLPHTLEHLVFCGSASRPHRGYLDHLALRCYTSGTNAWTADDHTAYTAVTAGAVGLVRLLPVFVDHVLHPTLQPSQFVTEVYHIDGRGHAQGVVYAEMNGRENTEADLADHAVRALLYPRSPFAHECGGRTDAIATLSNDAIRAYHHSFYRPERMAVLVCGQVDTDALLDALADVAWTDTATVTAGTDPSALAPAPVRMSVPDPTPIEVTSRVVPFPSANDDVASLSLAWRCVARCACALAGATDGRG